ncbi:MAG TPA: DUF4388 domain-containing protein [Drouetiella sp.]|jgi:GGDEF domain-containing protein
MFSPKKPPPDPSKIRLPKAAIAPVMAELQAMHQQALETGREVEQIWSEPDSTKSYSMSARFENGAPSPTWTLWEDDGQEGRLVWKFETSDFELVNDVVCMLKKSKPAAPANAASNEPQRPRDPFESVKPQPVQQAPDPFGGLGQHQQNPYQSNTGATGQAGGASYQPGYFTKPDPQARPEQQQQQPLMRNPYLDSASDADVGATGLPMPKPLMPREPEGVYAKAEKKADTIEGTLTEMAVPQLLRSLVTNQATGKLEIIGEETVGEVYFESGLPKHASTPSEYGDGAIKELVTWEKGTYVFTPNSRTEMRSVNDPLEKVIADGVLLLDQKRHLKRAGLAYESYLVRLHKNLSDTELKLMLTKGAPLDFEFQRDVYQYLRHKRTFTDLLRDKPMDSSKWTALLFNFLSCGLIEIKQPDAIKGSALDFLGEARAQVQAIHESFIRPETGVYSYPALMYFMEYELHRYEAYNFPLSLIVFEIKNRRDGSSASDVLTSQAAGIAAMRIDLVKRPLDIIGHFEAVDYGLLLPNTTGSSAAFVANRILESLTATPLVKGVDRNSLELAFGIACLPADGDDMESLVMSAKAAKAKAKSGQFPIVLSRSKKSN